MCRNINTNESASMQGEWGSCLFSCNSCPLFGAHLLHTCSAAMFPQAAKARGGVWSLSFAFCAFTGNVPLDFCIYTCVVSVIGSLKLWSKKPSFFPKNTWTADLDQHSFLSVFLLYFAFLILEFLKKIGHTGIADTKKWLDQAVFPCLSNYHTLARE